MEPSNGSTSGFVSLATRAGDPELLRMCGLRDDILPETFEPGTVIGDVTAEAAEATGLNTSTRVVPRRRRRAAGSSQHGLDRAR